MKYNETLTEQIRKGKAAFKFDHSRNDESIQFIKHAFPLDNTLTNGIYEYYYGTGTHWWKTVNTTTLPIITISQLLEEGEIEGYMLKEECKQYEDAVNIILKGCFKKIRVFERYDFQHNSHAHQILQQAGVLDLWFKPVYKKASEKIMIGEHEVKIGVENAVINNKYYSKQDLTSLKTLMKFGDIKSLNCGCSGQYKVDLETINRILDRMKQL